MAIATGNPVKFAYVTGNALPATVDDDTVYFVAGGQKLYVGSALIADHLDISGKQDEITVTTSGSGDYVSNVAYNASTATFTITKSTLATDLNLAQYALASNLTTLEGTVDGIQDQIDALGDTYATDAELTAGLATKLDTNGDASQLTTGTPATDTAIANKKYVDDAVAGLAGAMHFKGVSTTAITDGGTETATIGGSPLTPAAGDVVLYGDKEFVWTGSAWEELGDEGSFALKTTQVIAGTGLTGGGALSSNVTVSHGAIGTASADDITADSTGHLYVMTGVDKDQFGHVASVNEKDIYSTIETIAATAAQLVWNVQ